MPLLELKNLGGLYRCIGKGASKGLCPCSGSRFEAVQAVHSRGQSSAGSIGQYPHHFVEDGMELLGFLLAQAAQYVTGYLAAVAGVADARAYTLEVVGAHVGNGFPKTSVASVTAAFLALGRAWRQAR